MRTIYKFTAQVADSFEINVPQFSLFRHVERIRALELSFWFEVDTEVSTSTKYKFWVFGTGHEIPEDGIRRTHIKTVMDGALVWHIFVEGYLPQ